MRRDEIVTFRTHAQSPINARVPGAAKPICSSTTAPASGNRTVFRRRLTIIVQVGRSCVPVLEMRSVLITPHRGVTFHSGNASNFVSVEGEQLTCREYPTERHRRICRLNGYIWVLTLLWIATGMALLLEANTGRDHTTHHDRQKAEHVAVLTSRPMAPTVQP